MNPKKQVIPTYTLDHHYLSFHKAMSDKRMFCFNGELCVCTGIHVMPSGDAYVTLNYFSRPTTLDLRKNIDKILLNRNFKNN